jgi:hypothetical protein
MKEEGSSNPVVQALSSGLGLIYDQVAVKRDKTLEHAREYDLAFDTWEDYGRRAGAKVMDGIADRHIRNCQLAVASLGAAAGFGGFITLIPDALQFATLTMRMVSGIAAAYGFDPSPDFLEGRVKVLVLQAYANALVGDTGKSGIEKVSLSAATKLARTAAMRSNALIWVIMQIARLLGLRLTQEGLLKSIPVMASGANAGFNYVLAGQIGRRTRIEFRQFRDDLRKGKYAGDSDYDGLGN